MPKQDLNKLLSQSAARSTPVEIRRGRGVGLSVEGASTSAQEPQVLWVEIDHLLDNPYQHAEEIQQEDFVALVESIKLDGFQGALNVSPVEGREGYYFLLSGGHQRRNAAREAGLATLPVFVNASPQEKKQLGLRLARENTAQVNRSPVNLGFLYRQLIDEFGCYCGALAVGRPLSIAWGPSVRFFLKSLGVLLLPRNAMRGRDGSHRACHRWPLVGGVAELFGAILGAWRARGVASFALKRQTMVAARSSCSWCRARSVSPSRRVSSWGREM